MLNSAGKIYIKFFLVFLAIALIPLLILGGTNLFGFSQMVRDEQFSCNEQFLQNSASYMDLYLRELRDYTARMSLISWSLENDYYADNSISDYFLGLRATSEAVIDAFVYFPDAARVVNCEGLNESDFYFRKVLRLSAEDRAELTPLLGQRQSFHLTRNFSTAFDGVSRQSLILLNSYPNFSDHAAGMIGIVLDVDKMISLANRAANGEYPAELCIFEPGGKMIASSTETWKTPENTAALSNRLLINESRQFLSVNGESYIVSSFPSSICSLTYVMIKSAAQITRVSDHIRNTTLTLSLVLVVLGMLIGYVVSKNFYKPIYQLMHVALDADSAKPYRLDDRLDEFEIISGYIGRLQEESRRMESECERNANFVQEYCAQRLLLGIAATDHSGSEELGKQRFVFSSFYSVILYVTYDEIDHDEYTTRMSEISRAVRTALSGRPDAAYIVISVAIDRLSLIVNCDSFGALSTLVALLSKTVTQVNAKREFMYGIGVGDVVDSLERISESYKQAQTALKHRTAVSSEQTVFYQDIRNVSLRDTYIYYPLNAEKSIVYNLVQGNIREVVKITDNLIAKNNLECATVRKIEFFYQQFIIAARKTVLISNLSDTDKFNLLDSLNEPKETDHPAQMKSVVYSSFAQIASAINQSKKVKKENLANQMIEYVSHNYASSISLDILADEFGFSAKYLSSYFKSSTGMNYVDFLNSIRIDNAKRLIIEQPNLKIADISETVGFINPSTFIASFRKSEGVTPGTYRARYFSKRPE